MNWDAILWLILLVGFLLVEAATVTMVSLWFAVGALVAMIASFWNAQMWLQVLLFLVVSGVMLILLRPMSKKYFTPKLWRYSAAF